MKRFLALAVALSACGPFGPAFDRISAQDEGDAAVPVDGGMVDSGLPDGPSARDSGASPRSEAGADGAVDATVDTSTTDARPTDANARDSTAIADVASEQATEPDAAIPDGPPLGPFTIGGAVSGLAPGETVSLSDNGGTALVVSADGTFVFPSALPPGATYDVAVVTNPASPSQTCVVSHGAGTVAASNVTGIEVTCTTNAFTVGGTVVGLPAGQTVVLQDNGADTTAVTGSASFQFPTTVASGSPYDVTVLTQPSDAGTVCTVSAGQGTVGGAPVGAIVVDCAAGSFTIGGTLMGLAQSDSVAVQDNGSNTLFLTTNGGFAFSAPVSGGSPYDVTIQANPMSPVAQTCTVGMPSGTASGNVTNVTVACTTLSFPVGGTVTGLSPGASLTLQNEGIDTFTVSANGAFQFPTPVPSGQAYSVSVATASGSTVQEGCTVTSGNGVVGAGPVTNVAIQCWPCIVFEGCVDGEDQVTVASSTLSIDHIDFSAIGEHPACMGVVSTVNPSVSLYDPTNGVFAINGVPYPLSAMPQVAFPNLVSFTAVMARGPVTLASPNTVDINDNDFGGPALYVVGMCD